MSLTAQDKGGGTDFDPIPQGLHEAVCYAVFDLGTHHSEKWNKDRHEVVVIWELPSQRIEIERDGSMVDLPRAISRRFTLSLHSKADLRKNLESWRGRKFTEAELKEGFDLKKLLEVNAQLNVIHNPSADGTRTYANISAVVPAPKGVKLAPENPLGFFSFEEWPEKGIPVNTPEWIQEIIKQSKEFTGEMAPPNTEEEPPVGDPAEGGIPF